MRSRTSRGVSEWSGGKELYIESAVLAIGTSFGVIGIVPGPPEGPGVHRVGPPASEGPHGLYEEGNQPKVGWCASPPRAHAPRVGGGGNPKGGPPPCLGRKPPSLAGAPQGVI